jgi:hypothetical protein
MSENFESRQLKSLDEFRNEMKLLTRELTLNGSGPTVEELEQQGFCLKITGAYSSTKHEETYYLMRKGSSVALVHEVYVEREGGLNFRHYYGDARMIKQWNRKFA